MSTTNKPQKRTRKSIEDAPNVYFAKDLAKPKVLDQIEFCNPKTSAKGMKYSNIKPFKGSSSAHVMTIVLDNAGYLPSFSTKDDRFGTTAVCVPVISEEDRKGLEAFDNKLFEMACGDDWWPEREPDEETGRRAPSKSMLKKEGFRPLLTPGKAKKDGSGNYLSFVKAKVEMTESDELKKGIKVCDKNRNDVNIYSVPNAKVLRAVIEIPYTYFSKLEFGPVKRLRYLKIDELVDGEVDLGMFDDYEDDGDDDEKPNVTEDQGNVEKKEENNDTVVDDDWCELPPDQHDLMAILGEEPPKQLKKKKKTK